MNALDGMNYAPKGKPEPVVKEGNFTLQPCIWITVTSTACAMA